jgi:hypothetical protein
MGRKSTVNRIVENGEIISKECTSCGDMKKLEEYTNKAKGLGGKESVCKACRNESKRVKESRDKRIKIYADGELVARECTVCREVREMEYYIKNSGKCRECRTNWARNKRLVSYEIGASCPWSSKKERAARESLRKRKWQRDNIDRVRETNRVSDHVRRARQALLTDDFTIDDAEEISAHFKGCAITGRENDVHLDHFIPLSTGHGGSYKGNMLPMFANLNVSKKGSNPFEWVKNRDDIDLERWERAIEFLAEQNGLTSEEFESFVHWCFENKRDIGEIEADNRSSLEIWKAEREAAA